MAEIPFGGHFSAVLDSLAFLPSLRTLSLPAVSHRLWDDLGRFIALGATVEHLTCAQPVDGHFASFARALAVYRPPQLQVLGFTASRLDAAGVTHISELYAQLPIPGLSISRGLLPEQLPGFFRSFGRARALRALHLDQISGLEVSGHFAFLEVFERLSLRHCCLDAGLFLKGAARSTSFAVAELDLSGNDILRGFGPAFVLPPSVRRITLNDVLFAHDSLASTLRFCLAGSALVALSIATVDATPAEADRAWRAVLAEFPAGGLPLQELCWDGNPVTPAFLQFLEKCPRLRILSLNGALPGGARPFGYFCEFIANNATVTDLSVCGNLERCLTREHLIKLFAPLKTFNRTVRRLELAHNVFDRAAFEDLAEMLTRNRVIETVVIHDFDCQDPAPFLALLAAMVGRGVGIDFPLPRVDIEGMVRTAWIDAAGLETLMELRARAAAGDLAVVVPPETTERTGEPPAPAYRGTREEDRVCEAVAKTVQRVELQPQQNEWALAAGAIPEPDIGRIVSAFREEFAFEKLVVSIKEGR
jgi:hypothetical protein